MNSRSKSQILDIRFKFISDFRQLKQLSYLLCSLKGQNWRVQHVNTLRPPNVLFCFFFSDGKFQEK